MNIITKLLDFLKLESTGDLEQFNTENAYQRNSQWFKRSSETSQFSELPRYYTINGRTYDIDNPEDIRKLPVFAGIITIGSQEYGMDSILRKHSFQSYIENKDIYNAAQDKLEEYSKRNIYFETADEKKCRIKYKERQRKLQQEKLERINLHDSFKIEDMYQFSEIPFEWHWVIELNHTNGIAWFMLNKNNQYIALSAINFINNILEESKAYTNFEGQLYVCTENIDFNYPIPCTSQSTTCTFVECNPYTKTGKISKYPATLHFKEFPKKYTYGESDCYVYRVHGDIYFMSDGNIGKADLTMNDYYVQIRLHGLTLAVQRIWETTLNGNIDIYRNKI